MVEGAGEQAGACQKRQGWREYLCGKERGMLTGIITKALGEPSEVGYHKWVMAPSSKAGEFYPAVHREDRDTGTGWMLRFACVGAERGSG